MTQEERNQQETKMGAITAPTLALQETAMPTKDKVLSIRVDSKTYAKIVEEQTRLGYKSLSAFAVDQMLQTKYTSLPDIARTFTDVEDALNYGCRLEQRAKAIPESESDVEDLRAEIMHFKVFVCKKAEVLLDKVREEFYRNKR